jgi:hypothetical protein
LAKEYNNPMLLHKLHPVLRSLGSIGMLILFTWRITQKQFEPLFYLGAALLIFGVFYNPLSDWRAGKKKEVITNLKIAGVVIAIALIIIAVKRL